MIEEVVARCKSEAYQFQSGLGGAPRERGGIYLGMYVPAWSRSAVEASVTECMKGPDGNRGDVCFGFDEIVPDCPMQLQRLAVR